MLPKPEKRTVDVDCPVHGWQQVDQVKIYQEFGEARCPLCAEQRRAEQEERDALEREQQRADGVRRALEQRLSGSLIPPRFAGKTLESFETDNDGARRALAVCAGYAQDFDRYLNTGTGMMMTGNTGTGKTHLACGIAQAVIRAGRSACYVTAARAFRMIKETFVRESGRSEQQAYDWFTLPDLLVIDEIGVQFGSDVEKNILFEIINVRYERLRPSLIISNLALPSLSEYAGDRVVDRMREAGGKVITFTGHSYRGNNT